MGDREVCNKNEAADDAPKWLDQGFFEKVLRDFEKDEAVEVCLFTLFLLNSLTSRKPSPDPVTADLQSHKER